MINKVCKLLLLLFLLAFFSCERNFDYSIYSAKVKGNDKHTRKSNYKKLNEVENKYDDTSSYTVALISDSHTYYDDLNDVVNYINHSDDIDFVIHGGDLTDGGILAEYYIFREIMHNLKLPYFTVIGNHDCLANGRQIYIDMFGPDNYSFVFLKCKFVFFNDVFWEMNYQEPHFEWLLQELTDDAAYRHKFVITHIPPWDEQYTFVYNKVYKNIMDSGNADLSVHGHMHDYNYVEWDAEEVPYLVIGSPHKRSFVKLKVSTDTVVQEKINF